MIFLADKQGISKGTINVYEISENEKINHISTLDFFTFDKVQVEDRVVFRNQFTGRFREYIITNIDEEKLGNKIKYNVKCENSIITLRGIYIDDKKPRNQTLSAVMLDLLKDSEFTLGECEITKLNSFNMYHTTVLEELYKKILNDYEAEIEIEIICTDNKITERKIHLKNYLGNGKEKAKRLIYKKDITSIHKEIDTTTLVTALYGYGKGEELENENGEKTGGYGRRIDFAEINDGKKYVENKEALEKYSSNGNHIFGIYIEEDCEDKKELLELTKKELEERSKPKITYTVDVADNTNTLNYFDLRALRLFKRYNLGDYVTIADSDLKTNIITRIVEIQDRDPLKNNTYKIILGNFIENVSSISDEIIRIKSSIESHTRDISDALSMINKSDSYLSKITNELNKQINATGGYVYISDKGEGIITYDKPIDQNPTKAIQIVGGAIRIANHKKEDGSFDFKTFGTGDGFTATLLRTGILQGGKVFWNLEDGTLLIGKNTEDYSLFWDGSVLHLKNLDVDIETNPIIKSIKEDLNKKLDIKDIKENEEIRNILKGKDGVNGKDGKDGKNGINGKDGKDGVTPTIGDNGNWLINGVDTNKKAVGKDGSEPKIINGFWYVGNKPTGVKATNEIKFAYADDFKEETGTVINFSLTDDKNKKYIGFFIPQWGNSEKDPKNYWWALKEPTSENIKEIKDILQKLQIEVDDTKSLHDKLKSDFVSINASVNNLTKEQQKELKDIQDKLNAIRLIGTENGQDLDNLENYINDKINELSIGADNSSKTIKTIQQSLNTYINNLPNEIKTRIQDDEIIKEVKKNFSFTSEGLTIGQNGSRYSVSLDNEKLSFKQDKNEVAYINAHRLNITEVEILESLKIFNLVFSKYKGKNSNGQMSDFVMVSFKEG